VQYRSPGRYGRIAERSAPGRHALRVSAAVRAQLREAEGLTYEYERAAVHERRLRAAASIRISRVLRVGIPPAPPLLARPRPCGLQSAAVKFGC